MASSTARPSSLTLFTLSTPSPPQAPQWTRLPNKDKTHLTFLKPLRRPNTLIIKSIDVSKEDKQEQPISSEEEKIDNRRLEEKFAVVNTGIYECRSCGYKYDEATGDPSYPIPPGLPFDKLPDDWRCPTCGASQSFFESKSMEIAGFAQNQQFGLGGNTLTSGQKALLIYGGLLLGFALFLSGYFLQ
ncbi:rubredoxin [Phtheirospermum japonicum]|uniref:Rubredoxin n=1 Tax=Phtheirospermum japonicum TaxID=374723 RepID=A0A830CQ57_9LAMI|nr:rubredoxin [Phtheirospermum japonicum]